MAKPNVTRESSEEIPPARPRWAFSKGLLAGAALEVPVFALALNVAMELGLTGDAEIELMRIVRLTTIFCGLAALLTAGGIGRLAAWASVTGGRRRGVWVGARAHAAAGAGLIVIAAVPHGHHPTSYEGWAALAAAGLIPGALCGAAIGYVCGGVTHVGLAEVWSLAQRPSGALRQLLSPKDLVKLGSALRSRTTTLFEGIFDPAPPPPEKPPVPPAATDDHPKPGA
jgi:hypothetical protein